MGDAGARSAASGLGAGGVLAPDPRATLPLDALPPEPGPDPGDAAARGAIAGVRGKPGVGAVARSVRGTTGVAVDAGGGGAAGAPTAAPAPPLGSSS